MLLLHSYHNGNTQVSIYDDGTKIRRYEGIPEIVHPESIDAKITNYCDLGCEYCHEQSTIKGIHGDLNKLLEILSELPAGVELAIGGGNPLSHPDLVSFLHELKEKKIIANITVNQGHLKQYQSLLEYLIKDDLVKGIGISITNNNFKYITHFSSLSKNIVYHVIAGINSINIIDKLIAIDEDCKILILGYKYFGFGKIFYSEDVKTNIREWYKKLPSYISRCTISFDNLGIEQLNVKRLFTHEGWNKFYMGDDFCYTMYIDAVKQQYTGTSRSDKRKSFSELSLLDFFQKYRKHIN